jgi:HPt (histidine-containing phosphotransfer) domain-containing protein
MSAYFDLERIRGLEDVLGSDAGAIVSTMLTGMTEAIDEAEAAMAADELDRAARAAHRCRNDAMMLGARQLLEALTELEAAGREYDAPRATAALERLRAVWPPTRAELIAVRPANLP